MAQGGYEVKERFANVVLVIGYAILAFSCWISLNGMLISPMGGISLGFILFLPFQAVFYIMTGRLTFKSFTQ